MDQYSLILIWKFHHFDISKSMKFKRNKSAFVRWILEFRMNIESINV